MGIVFVCLLLASQPLSLSAPVGWLRCYCSQLVLCIGLATVYLVKDEPFNATNNCHLSLRLLLSRFI